MLGMGDLFPIRRGDDGGKGSCWQIERCCDGGLFLRDLVVFGQYPVSEAECWRLSGLLVPPPVDPTGGLPSSSDAGAAEAGDQVSVVSPGSRDFRAVVQSELVGAGVWSTRAVMPRCW